MPTNEPAPRPATPQEIYGKNLRIAREARGMSQADLVEELSRHGINLHRQTIHKIEHADRPLKLDEAVAIANAMNSDMDWMLHSPSDFRVFELVTAIDEKRHEALRAVADMYELQLQLAGFLDAQDQGEDRNYFAEYLDHSGAELHDSLISQLQTSKELRHDTNAAVMNALYKALPDYYDLTVHEAQVRGQYMRRFLDAHPGLERGDDDGEH